MQTNKLPHHRQESLVGDYRIRLAVIMLVSLTGLALVGTALLVPTYIALKEKSKEKTEQLAVAQATLTSREKSAFGTRLSTLSNEVDMLLLLAKKQSASAALRSTLAVSRSGITISNFTYTTSVDKNPNTLAVSGIATTRDALRAYQVALQSVPHILSAELPISAYAKDTNNIFTITLSLAP